jgi:hypothetical protein
MIHTDTSSSSYDHYRDTLQSVNAAATSKLQDMLVKRQRLTLHIPLKVTLNLGVRHKCKSVLATYKMNDFTK